MFFSEYSCASFQSLGQVFFRSIKIAQIFMYPSKVVERFQGVLMPLPKFFPPEFVGQSESGFRFFRLVIAQVEIGQVVDACNGIGMFSAINLFIQFNDFLIVQLGTMKISLRFIQEGEVV